jgi:Rps23 Pro-64 3,4-dihydroxylase Tpa1-like proline 4-hydroxylase
MSDLFSPWLGRGAELHSQFTDAKPFPMAVIDDFLAPDLADGLHAEFPSLENMPRSRDYVFADKYELSSIEQTTAGERFRRGALSPEFEQFLRELTGFEVFVDPMFHGGGFHQGGDGSFLDMHVDFNVHPNHATWLRMLNILVYLNRSWEPAYGGDLLVKASPTAEPTAIAPLFNRAVIMLTAAHTYHGYRRMSLPRGVTRKSVAAYAYRQVEADDVTPHTTGWAPEGGGVGKRLLARHYDRLVRLKNRMLGSGTSGNR